MYITLVTGKQQRALPHIVQCLSHVGDAGLTSITTAQNVQCEPGQWTHMLVADDMETAMGTSRAPGTVIFADFWHASKLKGSYTWS